MRPLRTLAAFLAVVGLACSQRAPDPGVTGRVGPPGPQGAKGLAGPRGPQGPSAPGQIVYRDAAGALVSRGVPFSTIIWGVGVPSYVDARGFIWRVASETGEVGPVLTVTEFLYTGNDCSGGRYFVIRSQPAPGPGEYPLLQPRMPFRVDGETELRVRPDNQVVAEVTVASSRHGHDGACVPLEPQLAAALSLGPETLPDSPVVPPAVSFVPPLHAERE